MPQKDLIKYSIPRRHDNPPSSFPEESNSIWRNTWWTQNAQSLALSVLKVGFIYYDGVMSIIDYHCMIIFIGEYLLSMFRIHNLRFQSYWFLSSKLYSIHVYTRKNNFSSTEKVRPCVSSQTIASKRDFFKRKLFKDPAVRTPCLDSVRYCFCVNFSTWQLQRAFHFDFSR